MLSKTRQAAGFLLSRLPSRRADAHRPSPPGRGRAEWIPLDPTHRSRAVTGTLAEEADMLIGLLCTPIRWAAIAGGWLRARREAEAQREAAWRDAVAHDDTDHVTIARGWR